MKLEKEKKGVKNKRLLWLTYENVIRYKFVILIPINNVRDFAYIKINGHELRFFVSAKHNYV